MKKKIQEYYVNMEINVPNIPNIGVLMLAYLHRLVIIVTWLANRGMDMKVYLLNIINYKKVIIQGRSI